MKRGKRYNKPSNITYIFSKKGKRYNKPNNITYIFSKKGKRYNKQNNSNFIYVFLVIFFIGILIFSAIQIIKYTEYNKQNKEIENEILNYIEYIEYADEEIIMSDEQNIDDNNNKYNIDFESLKEKNPDTVGFLKVNGTDIENVVVQANDNNYYLRHNFNKEYNIAGWIFADYKNKLDGTDKNIVIYGHNMRDNSMFTTLKNVITKEWYNNEENYKIIFVTENEYQEYQVFSVYQIKVEDYYIQTEFTENEFSKFIDTIRKRSKKDFGITVTKEDTILTLSTCANNNKYRIVLHCVRTK